MSRRDERRQRRIRSGAERGRPDDDFEDGCDLSRMPESMRVRDEDIPWVVLFASVDRNDPAAVARKAQEWREVFSGI